MNVVIESITQKETWQQFLDARKPHTFLHSWQWGEFQKKMGNKIFRLGIFDSQRLEGVALVIKIKARRGTFLFCPHGPIIDWSKLHYFATLTRRLRELAKEERASFIRISPLAEGTHTIWQLFRECGFRNAPMHMHAELVSLLDLTPSCEELFSNMRKSTRYSVKKAEKDGVRVRASDRLEDVNLFYDVYERTSERQHFVSFSKAYLEKEFESFSTENDALLFLGEYNNIVLSAAMIIFSHGSAFYHHGASSRRYPQITASHLVQWEALREAKRRGCTLYNFWGIAPEGVLNHPWVGLTLFKKGFGGSAHAYFPAQDLILNSKYWLSYVIERLRKAKRGL